MPYFHVSNNLMRMQRKRMLNNRKKQKAIKHKSNHPRRSNYIMYEEPPVDIYKGDINSSGEYHGIGFLRTYYYTYSGEWRNNKRHGRGIERYLSGNIYNCTWINDKIHGIGEIKMNGKISFGYFYIKPNDSNIYSFRRSRRIAKFPPENNGLSFKTKKVYKPTQSNQTNEMFIILVIISFIINIIIAFITIIS